MGFSSDAGHLRPTALLIVQDKNILLLPATMRSTDAPYGPPEKFITGGGTQRYTTILLRNCAPVKCLNGVQFLKNWCSIISSNY